jgi:hypothetical protein
MPKSQKQAQNDTNACHNNVGNAEERVATADE